HSIRALMARHRALDWAALDEVVLGCANQAGEDNRNVARMAALLAGLHETVPALTVNRLCASGMDAVIVAARAIACGEADLIIAGGVESMSRAPLVMPKPQAAYSRRAEIHDTTIGWRFINPALQAQYGSESMPETAENVARAHNVSRAQQDEFALQSQQRAARAQKSGRLAQEITPLKALDASGKAVEISSDEHPRETTMEKLSALPAPFRAGGTVTAGNASGINDGAASLLVASESALTRFQLTPLAEYIGSASVGVAPGLMGMGPVPATHRLCARLGLAPQDFDLVELNEAFAAQALAVLQQLELDPVAPHINPNGGAIALGHPLGMTGARLIGTAAHDLGQGNASLALCTLCVGVGQGVAVALKVVD
ncbi:MAG: acetyl-CoA C-acyltransferase, partial [Paracoccaceae bacterium]